MGDGKGGQMFEEGVQKRGGLELAGRGLQFQRRGERWGGQLHPATQPRHTSSGVCLCLASTRASDAAQTHSLQAGTQQQMGSGVAADGGGVRFCACEVLGEGLSLRRASDLIQFSSLLQCAMSNLSPAAAHAVAHCAGEEEMAKEMAWKWTEGSRRRRLKGRAL